MNRQKLLCVLLMCFGFSLVYAAAQTQPAAGPPATAPTTPLPPGKTAAAPLPDPQTPEEFFARARQLSDLEASGIPFHLNATYVATGDAEFTGTGTYEEWWKSKDLWRKEATLGDYKYVEIQNGDKHTAAATNAYIPLRVRQIMGLKIFHIAMPEGDQKSWDVSQQTEGAGTLTFATRTKGCNPGPGGPLCMEQYAFNAGGVLQFHSESGVVETYKKFEPFRELLFPRTAEIALRGEAVLFVDIVTLEALPDADRGMFEAKHSADLTATPSMVLEPGVEKDVIPPKAIHTAIPRYPKSERKRRGTGMVVVLGTIDVTGILREPCIQVSAGPAFDQAAMEAVRKWKFKPASKDDEPGIADVDLEIDFRMY
jgi:TonB family protein